MSNGQRIVIAGGALAIVMYLLLAVPWLEAWRIGAVNVQPLRIVRYGFLSPPQTAEVEIPNKDRYYGPQKRTYVYPLAKTQLAIEIGGIIIATIGAFAVAPLFKRRERRPCPDQSSGTRENLADSSPSEKAHPSDASTTVAHC